MIGDKKAKQIAADIQTIKSMITKTAGELRNANVVTRLYLRELLPPKDAELIRRMSLQKEQFD